MHVLLPLKKCNDILFEGINNARRVVAQTKYQEG